MSQAQPLSRKFLAELIGTFVLVFGLIELGMGVAGMMGVAHFAHLGGMLGGWLMIRYWRGQTPFSGPRRR